jgi:hypothetical protein
MTAAVDVPEKHHDPRDQHDPHERRAAARERRVAHVSHGLTELLEKRPELAAACPLAGFAVDAVRWSA